LGTKWEFLGGRLATNAAIFRTEKTNARTDVLDSNIDILNGRQRVDGLELSMTGHINENILITAAYTYQDSEVVKAEGEDVGQEGMELASTPENSFSVWSRYQATEKLVFGLGAQYIDERYNSSDPAGREKADDYSVFDMMASYQINDRWDVQFNATNLTDKRYIDQLGGGHFVPGEGRYVGFTTRIKF
jgi:catecholate siderophore receptor